MKKLTSIATALCLVTGLGVSCAACADAAEVKNSAQPAASVSQSASTDYKVILCPGYQYGYGTTKNTVKGLTAMNSTLEGQYFVTNAYIATTAANAALPVAETKRTDVVFAGWAYAKDGEVVIQNEMPATLTADLYLYALWNAKGGNSGNNNNNNNNNDNNDASITVVTCTANNTYLRGNIAGTSCSWSTSPQVGVQFESNNKLTIKLTTGDEVKAVKYGANVDDKSATWYNNLTSSDTSAMANVSGNGNYKAKKTGWYTFTINGSNCSVSYSATKP